MLTGCCRWDVNIWWAARWCRNLKTHKHTHTRTLLITHTSYQRAEKLHERKMTCFCQNDLNLQGGGAYELYSYQPAGVALRAGDDIGRFYSPIGHLGWNTGFYRSKPVWTDVLSHPDKDKKSKLPLDNGRKQLPVWVSKDGDSLWRSKWMSGLPAGWLAGAGSLCEATLIKSGWKHHVLMFTWWISSFRSDVAWARERRWKASHQNH